MINVKFYSFSKKANSTKRPAAADQVASLDCELKSEASVFRPVLDVTILSTVNPANVNYAYIADFGRYYFIDDWSWSFGSWRVSLVIDTLASYKTQIGASSQYVLRSASAYDGDIQDMLYPVTTERDVTTGVASTIQLRYLDSTEGYYVIGIVGGGASVGSVAYYLMFPGQFTNFVNWLFDDTNFGANIDKSLFNPFQYVVSCLWFPMDVFNAISTTAVQEVPFGWWTFNANVPGRATAFKFTDATATFRNDMTVPKHPQAASRGSYLNAAPFSRYHIYFKPFGIVALDSNALKDYSKVHCTVKIDLINGNAEMIAGINHDSSGTAANSKWEILAQSSGRVGVPIQLSQVTADYVSGITQVVGSVGGIIGNALAGNVAGAIFGGITGIGNALQTVMPQVTTNGSNGGFTNVCNGSYSASGTGGTDYPNALMLISEFFHVVDDDNSSRGRPLCAVRQLNTLTGYILCADVELALPCTDAERQEVKNLMEGGFFYE